MENEKNGIYKFQNLDEFEKLLEIAKHQIKATEAILQKIREFEFEMVLTFTGNKIQFPCPMGDVKISKDDQLDDSAPLL